MLYNCQQGSLIIDLVFPILYSKILRFVTALASNVVRCDDCVVILYVPSQIEDVSLILFRLVLLGNHRDAWTFGAVDPNSGTSALLEVLYKTVMQPHV